MKKIVAWICAFALLLSQNLAGACSATATPMHLSQAIGQNFDWYSFGPNMLGAVSFSPRGLRKTSIPVFEPYQPVKWTSRYASYHYTIMASEFPVSGINERGLSIVTLVQNDGQLPKPGNGHLSLLSLQWVQYQLDNAASLFEVMGSTFVLQPIDPDFPLHFFVCDASRACGVFQYYNGRLSVHMGGTLKYPLLANSGYEPSLKAAQSCPQLGCSATDGSIARFANLAYLYDHAGPQAGGDYAWRALDYVRQPFQTSSKEVTTRHHVVYDFTLRRLRVRFPGSPAEAYVNLDFSRATCGERRSGLLILRPGMIGDLSAKLGAPSAASHEILGRASGLPEKTWRPGLGYAMDEKFVSCAR